MDGQKLSFLSALVFSLVFFYSFNGHTADKKVSEAKKNLESVETLSDSSRELIEKFFSLVEKGSSKTREIVEKMAREGVYTSLSRSCKKGNLASSCLLAGEIVNEGFVPGEGYEKAVEFFLRACRLGMPYACARLSELYFEGKGVPRDVEKAEELALQACNKKDAYSCVLLASYFLLRKEESLLKRAVELFEDACQKGNAYGCAGLGSLYTKGIGVPRDEGLAEFFSRKACNSDNSVGCNTLGLLYFEKNPEKAVHFFKKACELGNEVSCFNLGRIYQSGTGVKRDLQRARLFFQKACQEGLKKACALAGDKQGEK